MKKLILMFACSLQLLSAQSDSLLISSEILGHDVEVSIHLTGEKGPTNPIIYITDGQKLIEAGMLDRLVHLTETHLIKPATYIWISTRDSENPNQDYRNEYFCCNEQYLTFFEQELIPQVESHLKKSYTSSERVLMGVSFGGLNAAYFSAKSTSFTRYALLSPITYPCSTLIESITFSERKDLSIFLSTGTADAEVYLQPLESIYLAKGYKIEVLHTAGAHNFENWNNQLQRIITFLVD